MALRSCLVSANKKKKKKKKKLVLEHPTKKGARLLLLPLPLLLEAMTKKLLHLLQFRSYDTTRNNRTINFSLLSSNGGTGTCCLGLLKMSSYIRS
jgi:hypothetical protein